MLTFQLFIAVELYLAANKITTETICDTENFCNFVLGTVQATVQADDMWNTNNEYTMLTELKELMALNADMDTAEIEKRFEEIAKLLFENFAIQQGDKFYLFKDIEFYFYNKHHRDIVTHPRVSDSLVWYVNDFGGIDLNFPSEICKEGKKYKLDDNSYFGGILIRQLSSEDKKEDIEGPLACAELFRHHSAIGEKDNFPLLVEHANGMVGHIRGPRFNLRSGKQTVEKKVEILLGNYQSSPEEVDFCKEFSDFEYKRYKYVRCDELLHDSETNEVYFSPWLRDEEEGFPEFYQRLTNLLNDCGIKPIELKYTNDYWARDYMPIQLNENEFLKYKYEPDYLKDKKYVTDCTNVLRGIGIKCRSTKLKIDGGNMVPCGPYIVMTDKVFTENGREKGDAAFKAKLESELRHPVIIIPWKKHYTDIYGHSDGFIKWCGGNRILMGNHGEDHPEEAEEIRRILEDKGFEVTEMQFAGEVDKPNVNRNWAYINFLQVGNHIIMPIFNIAEDAVAKRYIEKAFPGCKVHQIEMEEIARKGGAMHCISWNIRR